jgi:hypothetical protein
VIVVHDQDVRGAVMVLPWPGATEGAYLIWHAALPTEVFYMPGAPGHTT